MYTSLLNYDNKSLFSQNKLVQPFSHVINIEHLIHVRHPVDTEKTLVSKTDIIPPTIQSQTMKRTNKPGKCLTKRHHLVWGAKEALLKK